MSVISHKKILVLIIILILAAATSYLFQSMIAEKSKQTVFLQPMPEGGSFSFQSKDGVTELEDFQGKVVLLYFGYTLCPDICPTSLSSITMALNALDPAELDLVRVVFVSVDPERDTVSRLKEYVAYFHKNIVGVTGSREAIDNAVKKYGAAYRIVDDDSAAGYLVDHSATIYLIDKKGALVELIPHGTPAENLAEILRKQIS